ncbi:Regulation of nuclear pre-mRNA domain containing protein 1B, variant 2 [Balamuthia mandrillaris]
MRLLDVWEQRQVFGAGFVRDIKNALQGGAAVGDKRKLGEWSKPANSLSLDSSSPALETNIVSKALGEQAQASLAVKVLEEKVSSLPDLFNGDDSFLNDVQSQTELREVATETNEACAILQQYSKQLEADLERRSKLISLLTDMIAEQENAMRQTSLDLSQSQDRLKNAEHLRSKITELMGKLPLEPGSPSQSAFVASFLSSDGDNNTSGTNGNDDDAYDPTIPSHMPATATSKSPTTPPTTPPGSPPLTDTNEQPFHSQKKARLGETSSVSPTLPSSSGSETTSSFSSASTPSPSLPTASSASFPLMSSSMAAATPTTTTTPTSIFDLAGSGYASLLSAYGWPSSSSSIAATTGQQAYIPGMSLPVSYQSGGLSSYLSSTAATSVSTTAPTATSATSATSEGSSSMTWS